MVDMMEYLDNIGSIPEQKRQYFKFHKRRFIDILNSLHIEIGMKVLDIGCGEGYILQALNRKGADIYGVDYKKCLLDRKIKFKLCNIESQKLPFTSNSFDYVIMSEVIEHIVKDIHLPLSEALRILKPSGKLVLTTPNVCELGKRLLFLSGKNIYWDINTFYERNPYDRHNREFTMDELTRILRNHGFKIVKKKYIASWEGLRDIEKNNLLAKIVSRFQRIIPQFRSNMLVIARKP